MTSESIGPVQPRVVVPLPAVASWLVAVVVTRAEGLLGAVCHVHAYRSVRPCSADPGLARDAALIPRPGFSASLVRSVD